MEDVIYGFYKRFTSVVWISDTAELMVVNYDYLIKNMEQIGGLAQFKTYSKKKIDFLTTRINSVVLGEAKINTFWGNFRYLFINLFRKILN